MDIAHVIGVFAIAWIVYWVHRWRNPKCSGKLPPGSMGLPLLGESHLFFSPSHTSDLHPFIKNRMKRYGPVFKTSLVGRPIVVSTDPDFNHFIFQEEGKLFQSWYPDTFTEIFGRQNIGSVHGFMHSYLKNMVLNLFGPQSLKEKLLPQVEDAAIRSLSCWSGQESVDAREAIATMIFNLTAKNLISYDASSSKDNLKKNFDVFMQGLISFPITMPGTSYHKCLGGKKKVMKMLKAMLEERKASSQKRDGDFFDYVLDELKKESTVLTEEISLDLMFALLFASFVTTSLTLTMAIKLLTDHPHVLEKLREEHEAILRNRDNLETRISWKEYKSMIFTAQVINETLRLTNIVPGIFRKALEDIQIKDYTIPSGWGVMVCPPAAHLNPNVYEDPLTFNPFRWEGERANGLSKHFMAFGGGMRFCVGADFSKLQMSVFLHCLVTKYRWKPIKGGNIVRNPGVTFPDGFHIQLFQKAYDE